MSNGMSNSDAEIVRALEVFGVDHVRKGMRAFPRVNYEERKYLCDCFVGMGAQREGERVWEAFGRVVWDLQEGKPMRRLSYAYEYEPDRLQRLAQTWLNDQAAIEEVIEPEKVLVQR